MSGMSASSVDNLRKGSAAIEECERFFDGESLVHHSLRSITHKLDELGIAYAVADGIAMAAHGLARVTVDLRILVTSESLGEIHQKLEGLGYVPPFAGSKQLKDVATGVRIEFLVTGQFPGDGKPKPISFPDPAACAVEIDGIRYLALNTLVELKLASGMTNPGRLKDLGDVQELIRALNLPLGFGQ